MLASAGGSADEPRPGFSTNDILAFVGGAGVVEEQDHAYFELLLNVSNPRPAIRCRNLGWEGDTVYEQRRDLNFGPWSEQFRKAGATVIVAAFGRMESLNGPSEIPAFIEAYNRLLDQFEQHTPRIVLVSPVPFGKAAAPLPDSSMHNEDLRQYASAIRGLAGRRGFHFVDLSDKPSGPTPTPLSQGVQLTPAGHWFAARETLIQLGIQPPDSVRFDPHSGTLAPPEAEALRRVIIAKNRLWFDYWRPMNWAFLAGDRTEQPSSRDHRDPKIRWFPDELEKFRPLIEAKEAEIADQARRLSTALPSSRP